MTAFSFLSTHRCLLASHLMRSTGLPCTPQPMQSCPSSLASSLCVCVLRRIWLFATPWTGVRQTPLSVKFSWQEYWSGLPCPPSGGRPDPGIKPTCLAFPALAGGLPRALVVKNLPANAGEGRDAGSIPGSGRSPWGVHGNPLQYSCLENHMDKGAWQTTVQGSQRVRNDWSNLAQGYKRTTDYWIAVQLEYQRQNWKPKLNASTVYSGSWKTQECTVGTARYLAYIPSLVTYSESSTQPCFTPHTLELLSSMFRVRKAG